MQTEVVRIVRKSFLKKYNKHNGWYVNWADLLDENEVYALVIEGSVDIQGLVALAPNPDKVCSLQTLPIRKRQNSFALNNIKYQL